MAIFCRRYGSVVRVCLKLRRLLTVLVIFPVMLGTVSSAPVNRTGASSENERCILCHVSVFDKGMASTNVHLPFLKKQCVQCHLGKDDAFDGPATGTTTGQIVSQESLWRKILTFKIDDEARYFEHRISLPALNMDTQYRFRICLGEQIGTKNQEEYRSLWFGLTPEDICQYGQDGGITISAGLSAKIGSYVESIDLSCPDNATIIISWETSNPLYGWIELQEVEGLKVLGLTTKAISTSGPETASLPASSDGSPHPELRDPEELAIEACYGCHSLSSLGLSHPVRLYSSGSETHIPAELPTVNGMLTCVTCHDAHGAPGKKLIREAVKTKLCVTCHFKFKNKSLNTMFD